MGVGLTAHDFKYPDESSNSFAMTKWQAGEPNNDGECVGGNYNGRMHDTSCYYSKPFICSRELDQSQMKGVQ